MHAVFYSFHAVFLIQDYTRCLPRTAWEGMILLCPPAHSASWAQGFPLLASRRGTPQKTAQNPKTLRSVDFYFRYVFSVFRT